MFIDRDLVIYANSNTNNISQKTVKTNSKPAPDSNLMEVAKLDSSDIDRIIEILAKLIDEALDDNNKQRFEDLNEIFNFLKFVKREFI